MSLYRDLIIDLYKNPLNKGVLEHADITGSGANLMCGDHVRIYANITGDSIAEMTFEGAGCAISIAAVSLLTEEAKKAKISEILQWGPLNIFEWLGIELGPARIKCGLLALETIQEALRKKSHQCSMQNSMQTIPSKK